MHAHTTPHGCVREQVRAAGGGDAGITARVAPCGAAAVKPLTAAALLINSSCAQLTFSPPLSPNTRYAGWLAAQSSQHEAHVTASKQLFMPRMRPVPRDDACMVWQHTHTYVA